MHNPVLIEYININVVYKTTALLSLFNLFGYLGGGGEMLLERPTI